jgi:hypothetical protein
VGYTRKRRVYNLTFDGGEYDGMQVRVRGLTVAQLEDVLDAESDTTDRLTVVRHSRELLAEHLLDWNVEDEDGTPLPPTLASLRSMDPLEVSAIVSAWSRAIWGVPAPLPPTSSDGHPSLEASIPMAAPSDNPTS